MTTARLIIVQPALPPYRVDFFNKLNRATGGQFIVYASTGGLEGFPNAESIHWLHHLPSLINLNIGLDWQPGALRIRLTKGDVLIVCGAPRTVSTILLLIRARIQGVKTIWWGHFWSATSKQWRFRLRLTLLKMSDAVVFYTDKELAEYQTNHNKNKSTLASALNNGIAVDDIQQLRLPYKSRNRAKSIAFIGRLTEKSGLEILIQALASAELTGVSLEIIGSGKQELELKSLASNLGVSEYIKWHGTLINENHIAAVLNKCRLFCYPGSVGLSLLHAMAYGLPAVIHHDSNSHNPEFAALQEGQTGRTFTPGSSEDLVQKLRHTLEDFDFLDKASTSSTYVADETYNTRVMEKRMMEVVRQLSVE